MFVARCGFLVSLLMLSSSLPASAGEPGPAKRVAQRAGAQKTRKAPSGVPAHAPRATKKKPAPAPPPVAAPAVAAPAVAAPAEDDAAAPAEAPRGSARPNDEPADSAEDTRNDDAARPISVAPLLGYATESMKLGIGIRGGYTLPMRLYVGAAFVYHLGQSAEQSTGLGTVETGVSFINTGAEVGYSIPVGPVVVRPYAGLGLLAAIVSQKAGSESSSDTVTSFAFWPGCTGLYSIPRSPAFVGADARLLLATEASGVAFGMFATGGMRF